MRIVNICRGGRGGLKRYEIRVEIKMKFVRDREYKKKLK